MTRPWGGTYKGQVDNPLSLNRYTYVHNNPLRYIDPSGNDPALVNEYGYYSNGYWWNKDGIAISSNDGSVNWDYYRKNIENRGEMSKLSEAFDAGKVAEGDIRNIPVDLSRIVVLAGLIRNFPTDEGAKGPSGNPAKATKNVSGIFAGNINAANLPKMSKQEILAGIPKDWKYTDHKGFVHVKDALGNIRMRIDPPDKVTKYDHVHLYDEKGNSLDVNLKNVDKKSKDAHIPYLK